MALRSKSNHSKSMSDIVDNVVKEKGELQENPALVENRYRTYTFKAFKEEEYFAKDSFYDYEKSQSTQKSQNFIKKLIASFEKRNEACKADDEFFLKYYKRNDNSNQNLNYLLDRKLHTPDRIRKIGIKIPIPNVESNKISWQNCEQEQNVISKVFTRNQVPVFPNVMPKTKFSPENYEYVKTNDPRKSVTKIVDKTGSDFNINEKRNTKYYRENQPQTYSRGDTGTSSKIETENRHDFSSFVPNQYLVDLQNRTDIASSHFLKGNENYLKGNASKSILANPIEGNSKNESFNGNLKKTLNRNKSFKDLFGSIVKWRKSENKERPQRFVSCDHLFEKSKNLNSRDNKKLSKASSFQTFIFQDREDENFEQGEKRKATIHPVYGGKRNEQLSKVLTKKNEDCKYLMIEKGMEKLTTPSAINDIQKHLYQSSQKARINDNVNTRKYW